MPFTVEEFRDLVRILEEKPEWRAELRRLVLTEELLSLPEQVAALRAETERRFQEMAGGSPVEVLCFGRIVRAVPPSAPDEPSFLAATISGYLFNRK